MVNLLVVNNHLVIADPLGPHIDGPGLPDEFQKMVNSLLALPPFGLTLDFIDDWMYHRAYGETHCGTNVKRAPPTIKWWEAIK